MNHNSTTSQFMDKQIMDLSMSQNTTAATNNNTDFVNFVTENKDDVVPSYDFMPIRSAGDSSSAPAIRSSNYDSGDDEAPPLRSRMRNSFDSKTNALSIRNYSSLDVDEPAKFAGGNNRASLDVSLISEIDRTMKKYMDNLSHALDGVSSRLSQVETRTCNLENQVDDLRVFIGNNHGSTDGKLRQLENILREVQTDVHTIKDKQDIVNAQLQISKLQIPKAEQVESHNTAYTDSTHLGASGRQQSSNVSLIPPPPSNAPPPPYPQQNFQPQVQLPNQFPQNQTPSVPQRESNFSQPGQAPENPGQHYQMPPPQHSQPQHPPPPPPQIHLTQQQYPPPPPPQPQATPQQYPPPPPQLQAPPQQHPTPSPPQQHPPPPLPQHQYQLPPQQQYSHQPQPSQSHTSFSINSSLPQPPIGHHPEEAQYPPSQSYPPTVRPSLSHSSTAVPPLSQQFYGPPSSMYDSPPSRPGPVYPGPFGPSSGPGEPYPYSGSPSQYGSGSPMKKQSPVMDQSGRSGYSQLPTARILPQTLPKASGLSGGSGSSGSGSRVSIDDVVDKVTSMGFARDQAMATVRRLTDSGQAVDLNIVLDKLMNGR